MNQHLWLTGDGPPRAAGVTVNCHRGLRGPYTGLGSALRIIIPQLWEQHPELVGAHATEIVTVAPELRPLLGWAPQEFTAVPKLSIRPRDIFYTERLAHGLTGLLLDWARTQASGPAALSFHRADQADHTDQEFLAILLRRAEPALITVTVATQDGEMIPELSQALRDHARAAPAAARPSPPDQRTAAELVRAYVDSDGTSTDPAELAAYAGADPAVRALLHDERAAGLQQRGQWSLLLGAVPYHRERGSDPGESGSGSLLEAAEYCLAMGFFHALLDLGQRGLAVTDPAAHPQRHWLLSGKTGTALATLGRPAAAEPLYREPRRWSARPMVHMNNSYSLAMLGLRRGEADAEIRAHLNNAIAIASLFPDPAERAYYTAIGDSGLAFADVAAGYPQAALDRLSAAITRLDQELEHGAKLGHRSVFAHQRGRILVQLGRLDEAVAGFSDAIRLDPDHPDYYADRGAALVRLGRLAEALRDYDAAIGRTPPWWELHHDRAMARVEAGELAGAVDDLIVAVDLEPGEPDLWVTLAGLLVEAGELPRAAAQAGRGLGFHPGEPRLLCARAQVALEEGRGDQARRDFDLALAADGNLVPALAGRADQAYQAGDHCGALADLSRAIEVEDDPGLRYNRALLYQETGDWQAAISDCTHALGLPGADRGELLRQRDLCRARLGDAAARPGPAVGSRAQVGAP